MITFSTLFLLLSLLIRSPLGRQYFTFYSTTVALARQPLFFPPTDSVAQLEEGHDAGWDRHPEGDQAEDQDRREDRFLGQAEEDEGTDHPGVHRPHPGRGEREEVGDHA